MGNLSQVKKLLLLTCIASSLAFAEERSEMSTYIKSDLQKQFSHWLKNNPDALNSKDAEGMTPTMLAASHGSLKILKDLLSKKVDLEIRNNLGDTALGIAVSFEQAEAAVLLIKAGSQVNINVTGETQDTLLMSASTNSLEVTKLILEKDKSVLNKTNKLGETALLQSVRAGYNKVAKFLLEKGADTKIKTKEGLTALDIAKKYHNLEAAKLLTNKK